MQPQPSSCWLHKNFALSRLSRSNLHDRIHSAGFSSHVIDIRKTPAYKRPRFTGTADYASRSMLHCKPTTYSDDLGMHAPLGLIVVLEQRLKGAGAGDGLQESLTGCERCRVIGILFSGALSGRPAMEVWDYLPERNGIPRSWRSS